MSLKSAVFHAHVYFESPTEGIARQLRERAAQELTSVALGVSSLINRPVGPHPLPMFEIDFYETNLGHMVDWLYRHRGGLNVLIHKDVKPETPEHTVNAIWLGTPQTLDLTKLDLGTDAVHNQIMNK